MNRASRGRFIFLGILITSLLLRFGLALVNREANDDHMEVIQKVIETRQLPTMDQCRECFHPKLFYFTAAALLQILPTSDLAVQVIFLQLLNFIAGAITLVVVYKFILEYPVDNEVLKTLVFALVALNPKLIAVQSQVSNDSFVILFSTLALYFAYHFIQQPSPKTFVLTILFLLLAVSTKVMGLITFVSITMSFLVAIPSARKKMTLIAYTFILLVAVILFSVINPLTQIVVNTQRFGTPIVHQYTRETLPLPAFFHKTYKYKEYYFRPGIVSIQDGFFTFKFTDLLKFPLIPNEPDQQFPPHRTSFWTMLYADAHSLHFQNWPPSWQTRGNEFFNISRGIFILALLPVFIIFVGFLHELRDFLKSLFHWEMFKTGTSLFLINFSGNMFFLILATLLYRDFAFIKVVYILPGLLSLTWIMLRGMDVIFFWFPARSWLKPQTLVSCWIGLLCVLYIWDVLAMISQLYAANVRFG